MTGITKSSAVPKKSRQRVCLQYDCFCHIPRTRTKHWLQTGCICFHPCSAASRYIGQTVPRGYYRGAEYKKSPTRVEHFVFCFILEHWPNSGMHHAFVAKLRYTRCRCGQTQVYPMPLWPNSGIPGAVVVKIGYTRFLYGQIRAYPMPLWPKSGTFISVTAKAPGRHLIGQRRPPPDAG